MIAERNSVPILLEGLKCLEYRGYDSAGAAVIDETGKLRRTRVVGKVAALAEKLEHEPMSGSLGVAHTRWATHGAPLEFNAHPHTSRSVAIVHNGIIENHAELRERLRGHGYEFTSETDTEVAAHLIDHLFSETGDLFQAVRRAVEELTGAYALGVISAEQPDRLVAARNGSPLVIGVGIGEHFIASDTYALLPVTRHFIYLENGDVAELRRLSITIADVSGKNVERSVSRAEHSAGVVEKGKYRHYMQKEIFEQPNAIAETLEGRVADGRLLEGCFGPGAEALFARVRNLHIVACGTSYHAGLVARYWIEELGVPCSVELASEYRYRAVVVPEASLFVTISQSGETADTLAALRLAKERGVYAGTLAICNVPESSLVRASDHVFMTRAGPEIGVASTKAFTTQLAALRLLSIAIGRHFDLTREREEELVEALIRLPRWLDQTLELDAQVEHAAERFAEKQHALFLGRGPEYPVALEGALKLKEISYIHAEGYAAGELKHGPLALVDSDMPVVCVLPNNELLDKVMSNLEEVRARGGELFLFAARSAGREFGDENVVLPIVEAPASVSPFLYTVALQLLAYHVAVLKGTDVDQPRNLAKSVTVE